MHNLCSNLLHANFDFFCASEWGSTLVPTNILNTVFTHRKSQKT